jgi:hypothetical protein
MKPTLDIKAFTELSTGELFQMYQIEDPQGGFPIDTADAKARAYSPFVIYIEPPNIISPISSNSGQTNTSTKATPFKSPLRSRAYLANNENSLNGASISSNSRKPVYADTNFISENNTSQAGLTDRLVGLDMIDQYKQLKDLPPLVFLINPNSMSITYNRVQAYQERTRFGYVYQAWGVDIPEITFSCKTGAFLSRRGEGGGLQFANMRDSASFRQVLALLAIYRNGATIRDRIGQSETINQVGHHVIEYAGTRYRGHLHSFGYGYDETQQNGNADFEFTFHALEQEDFDPLLSSTGAI